MICARARDLARIRASWQVWFQRSGELVLGAASGEGREFVLDEGKVRALPSARARFALPEFRIEGSRI